MIAINKSLETSEIESIPTLEKFQNTSLKILLF